MIGYLVEWWTMCVFWVAFHGPGIAFTFII